MGNYTVASLRDQYIKEWTDLVITKPQTVDGAADLVLKGKERYQQIEKLSGVPWYVVGIIHYRESDCNFHTHLHNGDSLNGRTHHVPAGRPIKSPESGHLPYTFEESAIDALNFEGFTKIKHWPIEQICYCFEQYNGWGYRYHHTPSAYLWADTNQYRSGKYVSDGVFDYNVVDSQVGTIGILKVLMQKDTTITLTPVSVIVSTGAPVPTPVPITPKLSPKAEVPPPSNDTMAATSRKYWWTQLMQWGTGLFGGSAAVVQTASTLNLDATKAYAQTIKDTADIIGSWGLIGLVLAAIAYFVYMKYLMKQDVVEGRATPSGAASA